MSTTVNNTAIHVAGLCIIDNALNVGLLRSNNHSPSHTLENPSMSSAVQLRLENPTVTLLKPTVIISAVDFL